MISDFSRYANGGIVQRVAVSSGAAHLAVYREPVSFVNVRYTLYLSIEGDTFSSLANKFYGDSTLWWKLADANPSVFVPSSVPPGVELRIPSNVR